MDYQFYYYKMTLYHEQTIPVFLTGYMLLYYRDYYQYHNNHQIQLQAYRMSAAYYIPHSFYLRRHNKLFLYPGQNPSLD